MAEDCSLRSRTLLDTPGATVSLRDHLTELERAPASEFFRTLDRVLDLTGQMLDTYLLTERLVPTPREFGFTPFSQKARELRAGKQGTLADLVDALRVARDAVAEATEGERSCTRV